MLSRRLLSRASSAAPPPTGTRFNYANSWNQSRKCMPHAYYSTVALSRTPLSSSSLSSLSCSAISPSSFLHRKSQQQFPPHVSRRTIFHRLREKDKGPRPPPTAWAPNLGLFGCPLKHPGDFEKMEAQAIELCNSYLSHIHNEPASLRTLEYTDAISNALCAVIDTAEICKNVHPSAEWREAAAATSASLSTYLNSLNHSQELYASIAALPSLPEYASWDEESKRVAMLLKKDMDAQGVGSPPKERERITNLLSEIHEHTFSFSSAHFNGNDAVLTMTAFESPSELLDALPREWASHARKVGKAILLPLDAASSILRNVSSEALRKQAFEQYNSPTNLKQQQKALEALISARQSLAETLGAESFAQHTVKQCVAGDQEHVRRLLTQVLESLSPTRNDKMASEKLALQTEKYLHQRGINQKEHPLTEEQQKEIKKVELMPWDDAFYMSRVRSNSSPLSVSSSISNYFSVGNVVRGFQILVNNLFPGLELRRVQFTQNEAWVDGDELIKLELVETKAGSDSSKLIGVIYLDLFTRPNKYSHAASFSIRSSCQLLDGSRQIPVVGIVCALPRPSFRAHVHHSQVPQFSGVPAIPPSTSNNASISLLSHASVEMLFHEFGHCLHNVLSYTKFQHVAGARGELDFVEMPSTLFEGVMANYAFVSSWAKHWNTNAPIPEATLQDLICTKSAFGATELIQQASLALFDQQVYGRELLQHQSNDTAGAAKKEEIKNQQVSIMGHKMSDLYHTIKTAYSPFHATNRDTSSQPYLHVLHLTTYAASYYCYLYCSVFATVIWQKFFTVNGGSASALNRTIGEKLRNQLFAHGGAKDPTKILMDLAEVESGKTLQQFVEAQLPVFIKAKTKQ